jgi:hypothetical protein
LDLSLDEQIEDEPELEETGTAQENEDSDTVHVEEEHTEL